MMRIACTSIHRAFAAGLALLAVLMPGRATAWDDVVSTVEDGGKLVSKDGDLVPKAFDPAKAPKGKAATVFKFHPEKTVVTGYDKDVTNNVVQPSPFTHTYPGAEDHGTKGSATYNLTISKFVDANAKKGVQVGGKVTGSITPGTNKKAPVSIFAEVKDPLGFSSNPDAPFDSHLEGLDYSFSLGKNTAFPTKFATDSDPSGALAEASSMIFRARVAAGYLPDPDEFWSDSLPGALDLFTLVLGTDADHNISADLTFASSTDAFALDFRDHLGASFDPTDAAAILALEQSISTQFVNGALLLDLDDLFTVGFTPKAGVNEYTFGKSTILNLGALEAVPEPGSFAMLGLGLAGCLASYRTRRRRAMAGLPPEGPGHPVPSRVTGGA